MPEIDFNRLEQREHDQIESRRRSLQLANPLGEDNARSQEKTSQNLVGLAFSGGGIRSATFNLGLLQGLANLHLLGFFDYLSTVSGGGYIGSWFTAWVHRTGRLDEVEKQLQTDRVRPHAAVEAEPIRHLRRHSNYLSPHMGMFSSDFWVLWATYLRNFLLCQLVLLPTVVAVLLLSRFVLLLYHPESHATEGLGWLCLTVVGTTICGVVMCLFLFAGRVRGESNGPIPDPKGQPLSTAGMNSLLVWLGIAALACCWLVAHPLPLEKYLCGCLDCPPFLQPLLPAWLNFPELLAFGIFFAALLLLSYLPFMIRDLIRLPKQRLSVLGMGGVAVVAGLIAGSVLWFFYLFLQGLFAWDPKLFSDYVQARATVRLATFGPPLVLAAGMLAIYVGVAVRKRWLREELREWWANLCGRMLILTILWLTVNFVSLYGTALVIWATPWLRAALGSGWLLTVAAGTLAGSGKKTANAQSARPLQDKLARFAPHMFVTGLLIGVSLLLHTLVDKPPKWDRDQLSEELDWPKRTDPSIPVTRDTTTDNSNSIETIDAQVRERTETLDEHTLQAQLYWLGLFNTTPLPSPKVSYGLNDRSLKALKNLLPERVWTKLRSVNSDPSSDKKQFQEQLRQTLGEEDFKEYGGKITRYAKVAKLIDFKGDAFFWKLSFWLGLLAIVITAATLFVDVNLFSLHAVYRNRLVRAYLGASHQSRTPDPVTGLDPNDDLSLQSLLINESSAAKDKRHGPYLIVNTALNLVRGEKTDWQERKADSFVLTPLYCGSNTTGYHESCEYGGKINLGTALAISGAAVSPNMGYHSSPAVTALLTVFNARLGAWLGNPANENTRNRAGPLFGFVHILRELFGVTNAVGKYIYLSDGGHFENLGVYELVRRRCRYIIASDSGQDRDHTFENLGNLIRKCRIDFGIRIQIDLGPLRLKGEKRCRWHCGVGKIRYDDVDRHAIPGILVYIKPCLTGDEPADVLQYAEHSGDFPHETTGDQFFSESQFESYRALGIHIAEAVFAQSMVEMESEPVPEQESATDRHVRRCRAFFSSIVRRWFAMPPEYEASFLESVKGFSQIQEILRHDDHLRRLSLEIYPELATESALAYYRWETSAARSKRRSAEIHLITQMLQVMENAWLSLNLDVHYAHPLNRGWMDVFHRWTSAKTFREHWCVLRSEFARDFVAFCETQMKMGEVTPGVVVCDLRQRLPELLCREFANQWPNENGLQRRFDDVGRDRAWGWLIYPRLSDPALPGSPAQETPCGIILVLPIDDPAPKNFEFFVWLRGAYRNSGLGRSAVGKVINTLREEWQHPFVLQVRLPIAGLIGPGGKLQKAMWLTFFYHHDFSRLPDSASGEAILERRFEDRTPKPPTPSPP